jgi:hypothetical protein
MQFSQGGWNAYYGKRLWQSRGVAMLVGSVIPATSAVAVEELYAEMAAQYQSAMDMLDKAAKDAVRWADGWLVARSLTHSHSPNNSHSPNQPTNHPPVHPPTHPPTHPNATPRARTSRG